MGRQQTMECLGPGRRQSSHDPASRLGIIAVPILVAAAAVWFLFGS